MSAFNVSLKLTLILAFEALNESQSLRLNDSLISQQTPPVSEQTANAKVLPVRRFRTIILRKNRIGSLALDVFRAKSNVRLLDLAENDITVLNSAVFSGLDQLSLLNLTNNQITGRPAVRPRT